jgi:hypothetical protein
MCGAEKALAKIQNSSTIKAFSFSISPKEV